jgi:hypothetical protein
MPEHHDLIERMTEINERLIADSDERQHFHGAYLRSTRSVLQGAEAGEFLDPDWTERWGLEFAALYMNAFDAWEAGGETPGPWQVAFDASRDPAITPLHHSLLGINAHINYDLPQAHLAVISDAEFKDDALIARRAADHDHVDEILVARVREEDKLMELVEEPGDRTRLDRLLLPFNRLGTKRFLKDGRKKTWANTRVLSTAREQGADAYATKLGELEALCQQRIHDLVTPRFVLIYLARHGFGIDLPESLS